MAWRWCFFRIFVLPIVSLSLGGCLWSLRWADDIHEFAFEENQNLTPIAPIAAPSYRIDDICTDEDFFKARREAGLPVYGRHYWLYNLDSNDKFSSVRFWLSVGDYNTRKYEIRNIAGKMVSTVEIIGKDYSRYKIREVSRYYLKSGDELKVDCSALIWGGEFKIEKIAYFCGENQDFREITKEEFFAKKEEGLAE